MQIFNQLTYLKNVSLALGFFDGLHIGHRVVLKNAVKIAQKNNTQSAVVIFRNHPLNFLSNQPVEQILTLDEKLEILKTIGIENVILLDFEDFASIKAADYLENVMVKYFSPIAITTGFNHSFGFNKEGNSEFLKKYQTKYGYKYYEIPPFTVNETLVSCSGIRNMLKSGNFYAARKLLGYDFFVRNIVINGDKIASKLGFPSANITYPEEKVKIPFGVYYVVVQTENKTCNGVLNYGFVPNTDGELTLKTEVHIIDFNENIYNKKIQISFIAKIREQRKFLNSEKLKEQINRDIAFAEIYGKFLSAYSKFI